MGNLYTVVTNLVVFFIQRRNPVQAISTVQEMFHENCENSKFHNFLILYPIYIKSSFFCLKMFALSFEINYNLDQISHSNQCQHKIVLMHCINAHVPRGEIDNF